jgi:hypothetical protein
MLVTIDELTPRLPFVLDADETREANGALEDLSFDAQSIGSALWVDATSTPQAVKNLILRAAARHMKNYEGYTVSRAGDETVQWAEQDTPGTATFSEDEKAMLRTLAGKTKFIGGVGTYAWGTKPVGKVGYVPTDGGGSDFPMFADDTEPW